MNKQIMEELKKKNKQLEEELKKKNKQLEEIAEKRRKEYEEYFFNEEEQESYIREIVSKNPSFSLRQLDYSLRYVKVLKNMLENLQLKGVEFFFVRITDNGHVEKEEILGTAKTEVEKDEIMKEAIPECFKNEERDLEFLLLKKGLSVMTQSRKKEENKMRDYRSVTYDQDTGQPKIRLFKYLKEEVKGNKRFSPKDLDEKGNLTGKCKMAQFGSGLFGPKMSEEEARKRMQFLGEFLKEIPFIELAYMWVRSCDKPPRIGYYDLEMLIGVRGVLPNVSESIYNYIKTFFSQEKSFSSVTKFYDDYSVCCEYIKSREDLEKRLYTAEFLKYLCLRNHAMYKYVSNITKKSDFEKFYYPFNKFMDMYISDRITFFLEKFGKLSFNEVLERSKDLNVKLEVDSKGNFLILMLELFMKLQKLYINSKDKKVYQEISGEDIVYLEYMSLETLLKKIKEIFYGLIEDERLSSQIEYVSINEILLSDGEEFFDKLKKYPEVYLPFKEISGKEIVKVNLNK